VTLAAQARSERRIRRRSQRKPKSRLARITRRIAERFEPKVAQQFVASIRRLQRTIDATDLASALASKNIDQILAAVHADNLASIMETSALTETLRQTAVAAGTAGAELLASATGLEFEFNVVDPRAVLYARGRAAELIVGVTEDVKEAVRIITATGQSQGLTVAEQARAIREVVGLPPNWVDAPLNLAKELREGRFTRTRRLSAVDKRQIESRLAKGTLDEPFIRKMQERYAESLRNRRAQTIARTETQAAAAEGQRIGWRDAQKRGVLPKTARRIAIVTPDERLRPDHARVPGMNPGGVALDQPYDTPWGLQMGPPWPADPYNCRCGEGLIFPGLPGVL
jgi:hypothetical protein